MTEKHSFWSTMPGMLTGIAAIVTAVSGLLLVFYQTGILDKNNGQEPIPVEETDELPGQTEEQEPNERLSEATPISVDTKVMAYLSEGNDVDVFAFKTGPGYRNVFEITLSNQGSFAPDIMIFDKMKNRIENKYSITVGADMIIPLSAQPSSRYFILVKDMDGFAGRLGDYQLVVKSE